MRASAVRGAILVAAVVVGGVVIANAFPSSGGPSEITQPTESPSPSHSPGPSNSPKPPKLQCPAPSSVRVAVENATSTAGLAAATATKLTNTGYNVNPDTDIGNAPSESTTTTVYFRGPDNKIAARCVKKKLFPTGAVVPIPAEGLTGTTPAVGPLVQVAVYLGSDYAAANPVA
ncbi:MAG: LytR C-terminal domain-containing protein [Actinomycetota bacterium]|nr:LytR C-terminal domain-containing protein [Actinomycetota bacterium]